VTVREADNLQDDTESAKAPKTSENTKGLQLDPINDKFLKLYFPYKTNARIWF